MKTQIIMTIPLSVTVILLTCHMNHAFVHPLTTVDHRLRLRECSSFLGTLRREKYLYQQQSRKNNNYYRALFVAAPRRENSQQSTSQEDDDNRNENDKAKKTKEDEKDKDEVEAIAPPRYEPPEPHMEDVWAGAVRGSKFRKLKDMMWIRETIEDLTAAEFACSVEAYRHDDDEENNNNSKGRRRRRAVDYDKLLTQLNKRLRDLGCQIEENNNTPVSCTLDTGVGKGTTVYDDDQRNQLKERVLVTREQLITVIRGYKLDLEKEEESMDLPFSIKMPPMPQLQKEENSTTASGPKLYVRDDGTLDWDGALQDRAALQQFGTAVWARINGRDPSSVSQDVTDGSNHVGGHGEKAAVTAKIEDTPQILEARKKLNELDNELAKMENAHRKLLNSALSEGQPVANVNLASLAPSLRVEIRDSADELEKKKQEVAYQTLIYELERIYTYLVGEVGNPANKGYVPLQDRLNVAEFGLLESQIDSFTRQLEAQEIVDADVLLVVGDQVTDLKRRLGIDFYVTGVSFDAEAIKRVLGDLLDKTKKGLAFYGRGIQLFWNDILFCSFLIGRAAQGYTLKPREVRNLRRTFKDFITFIPFIIILLIPLSPIGHVFVFGAIQRFFPNFFPSCFTEQRQNLLQLYETAEYSEFRIKESPQQKLSRLSIAAGYFIVNTSRNILLRLVELLRGDSTSLENDDEESRSDDGPANGSSDDKKF